MSVTEQGTGTLALNAEVVVTVLENEAVLLDLQTKFFYSINASGWAIVQMLEHGARRADIHAQCRDWGAPPEAAGVVDQFLDRLAEDGLLVQGATPTGVASASLPCPWSVPVVEKHREPLQRIMVSAFDPSIPLAE